MAYRSEWLDEVNSGHIREVRLQPAYVTGAPYPGDVVLTLSQIIEFSEVSRAIQPMEWSATHGGATVRIVAGALPPLSRRRGSLWELVIETATAGADVVWRMWLTGTSDSYSGGQMTTVLTLQDIQAMQSRAVAPGGDLTLFAYAGEQQALTGTYTVGSTVPIGSTSSFYARTVSGNPAGMCRITPDTSGNDEFFVRWNASTATTLTDAGADPYGTTRATTAAGTVTSLGYYEGHPARFAEELYTGRSVSGIRSVSDSGSLGLPDELYDTSDSEVQVIRTGGAPPTSGAHAWGFWVDAPMTMDLAAKWLAAGGWFVTQRGGRVTCRHLTEVPTYWDPDADDTPDHTIEVGDLKSDGSGAVELESAPYGDGRWPAEYRRVRVYTQAGTGTAPIAGTTARSYPTLDYLGVDLDNTERTTKEETVLFNGGVNRDLSVAWVERIVTTRITRARVDMPNGPALYAETANNAKIAGDLARYTVHAPHVVTATVIGMHPEYTLGDRVRLGDSFAIAPSADGGTLAGRVGLLAGVRMDLAGMACTVEVWIPPLQAVDISTGGGIDASPSPQG